MTVPQSSIEKLRTLAHVACDGTLTEDDAAQLEALLSGDAAAQDFYLARIYLDGWLRWEFAHDVPAPVESGPAIPAVNLLATEMPGATGYFSSSWPVAYLIATVVFAAALSIAAVIHVSRPASIVLPSSSGGGARYEGGQPSSPSSTGAVARVTGMVDCVWEDSRFRVHGAKGGTKDSPLFPLPSPVLTVGDTLALRSGLLELTYDTGAKVILQGPVTYEVESASGGYLSVGKLTARLERRLEVRGQKSEVRDQTSEVGNHQFAVRTPTALVTDLGTEFGVEVDDDGITETHVFEGRVIATRTGRDGHAAMSQTLSAGQGMHIETDGMAMITQQGHGQSLIRSMPRRRPPVTFIEPAPYRGFENREATPNISPFSKAAGGPFGPLSGNKGQRHWIGPHGQYFYLDDLESGEIRTPGLSRMGGKIQGVTIKPDTADSVDEDDGAIDGGNDGARTRSLWFSGDGASLTLSFDARELGRLPTHVGFVITDCSPNVNTQIEVFDGARRLLAKHKVYHTTFTTEDRRCGKGQAAKARFVGVVCNDAKDRGIGSIVLTEVFPNGERADQGIEIDHIQYGVALPKESLPTAEGEKPR